MTEVIVFPDTIGFVAAYLSPQLTARGFPDVKLTTTPAPRGDRLEVWLQSDGGPTLDVVREVVRVRVNCFADDPSLILPLTQLVSALMVACKTGPVVRVARASGPILITPSVKPQTLMSFELTVRGTPVT